MRLRFCGQVPKDFDYPESNEDSYSQLRDDRVALSDGASESFDSKLWARLLVDEFTQDPALTDDWLNRLVSKYASHFDANSLSWSKLSAYERGSFATLIGVEYNPVSNCIDVIGVGDSVAVLVQDGEFVESFPYRSADDFKRRPVLLSTKHSCNDFFYDAKNFRDEHLKLWSAKQTGTFLLCMTDAIGEWAMRNAENGTPQWNRLRGIKSCTELQELVSIERARKQMRIDDVTLIVISFEREAQGELPNA